MISCSPRGRGKNTQKNGSSPLLWSAQAIYQLLGCRAVDLLEVDGQERGRDEILALLNAIESRLEFSRIIALFGWYPHNGKLAICKVVRGEF